MTNQDDICKTSTLVAIDISMQRHEVLVQPPGRKRYRMSITNDRVDHDRLIQHLHDIGGTVNIAFEATGNYHRALAWRLIEVVSPEVV